jgi:diaminopimelate decarboxylase
MRIPTKKTAIRIITDAQTAGCLSERTTRLTSCFKLNSVAIDKSYPRNRSLDSTAHLTGTIQVPLNETDNRFRLSESQAESLARRFGTPLYVVNEATLLDRIQNYQSSFRSAYPDCEISFASKANSSLALLKLAYNAGVTIDVASEGELRAALMAGIPANACHMHGNNKQASEIEFAHDSGISHVVIDHFGEIETIHKLRQGKNFSTRYILRLAPGVNPKTHSSISTGQSDTKFGFNISDGSAEKALLRCLEIGLPVDGIHCHVGSQLLDPEAQIAAGLNLASFAVEMMRRHGYETRYLNFGGGLGVRYTDSDFPTELSEYCKRLVDSVVPVLSKAGLRPRLAQEPGRSLIAEAGVTLYTVGVVKMVPISEETTRTYVAVDGGLSDNPRPVMYQAKYTVERVHKHNPGWEYQTDGPGAVAVGTIVGSPEEMQNVTISGKHCETDTLFKDVSLPRDTSTGDLIQVLCTGAYNASMANNYNRYPRPAAVLIRLDGSVNQIARRDTWDEMFAREMLPVGI